MPERRRYTKRQKLMAVVASELSSGDAAAEVQHIPRSTLQYWLHRPEFAELRRKTREDLADSMGVLSHLAAERLVEKVNRDELDGKELIVLLGVATDKGQLLAGNATSRTETRDLTGSLDDHERERLRDILDGILSETPEAHTASDPVGVGAEVRE